MRLYRRHDADLMSLFKQKDFSLQKAIKSAVLAYLDNDDTAFELPEGSFDLTDLPSTAQFHLYLSEQNEEDVKIQKYIALMPVGLKNSMLKNLTRYYIRPTAITVQGKNLHIN